MWQIGLPQGALRRERQHQPGGAVAVDGRTGPEGGRGQQPAVRVRWRAGERDLGADGGTLRHQAAQQRARGREGGAGLLWQVLQEVR